eukprot:GHUV01005768.1.p1 GENE.GHUV01005768.1~~GHUV01005768.1.p1  ORF type:complete len:151 (+),score=30.54 GHUV01005768.1:117-569(+)
MTSLRLLSSAGSTVTRPSARCSTRVSMASPSTSTVAHPHRSQQSTPQRLLLVRSADVSNPTGAQEGQMNKELMAAMESKISEALEAQHVSVSDVYGDGRHVNINVISSAFEGKSSVQRQRMVYKAIWLELQDAVHAVDAMTTKTPPEAAA